MTVMADTNEERSANIASQVLSDATNCFDQADDHEGEVQIDKRLLINLPTPYINQRHSSYSR